MFLVGLIITAVVFVAQRRESRRQDEERFRSTSRAIMETLDARMENLAAALTNLRDMFAFRENVDDALWANYLDSLDPKPHVPGLWDVGFAERVFHPAPDLIEYIRQEPAYAKPYFDPELHGHLERLRLRFGHYERRGHWEFPHHLFPITFYHRMDRKDPLASTREVAGRELVTNSANFSGVLWAIGTTGVGRTPCIQVLRTNSAKPGLRFFHAVFRPEMPGVPGTNNLFASQRNLPAKDQQAVNKAIHRQRYTKGIVFGTVVMETFVQDALAQQQPDVGFRIYDRDVRTPEALLHETPNGAGAVPYLRHNDQAKLFGKGLDFEFFTLPAFEARSGRSRVWWFAAAGLLLTLAGTALVAFQIRSRLREEAVSAELRVSRDHLQASLDERDRVSRDLHDGTLQSVYALGLALQSCRRWIQTEPEKATARVSGMLKELDDLAGEVRRMLVMQPRPPGHEGYFANALRDMVQAAQTTEAAIIDLTMDEAVAAQLTGPAGMELLNIAREALSNSLRHGHPRRITIKLCQMKDAIGFEVSDDVAGFNPEAGASSGNGLRNMRERARRLQGQFSVESRLGGPSVLRVTFPSMNLAALLSTNP